MKRLLGSITMAIVIGALGVPVALAQTSDAWTTVKTKITLLTTEGVSTRDLNVDTVNGVVTLHGMVSTDAEKAKAETVARGITGVKDVQNLLQVVPEAKRESVEAKDDQILADVKAAFKADPTLDKSGINVSSVNRGVVLLSGHTPSHDVHLKAIEAAYRVKGVKRVATEVQSPTS
jgi:hyperosmotically inducible protein